MIRGQARGIHPQITEILSRLPAYSAEVTNFEATYRKSCGEFTIEYEANKEDFEKYDDLKFSVFSSFQSMSYSPLQGLVLVIGVMEATFLRIICFSGTK
jgi:hypothetical protein